MEINNEEFIWVEQISFRRILTKETGPQEHLLTTLKVRKLHWFAHINLAPGLANLFLQDAVEGKRGRGRPQTAWLDNIVTWTGRPYDEI